jgi:hypothetical protein
MSTLLASCSACGAPCDAISRLCGACNSTPGATAFAHAQAALLQQPRRRGIILRDTNAGPGLLAVDQRQLLFQLEHHWAGQTAPRVDMTVNVQFDANGGVARVEPVSEAELARERLDKLKGDMASAAQAHLPKLQGKVEKTGKPVLGATALLALAWLWLPALNIRVNPMMSQGLTLFDVLRFSNAGSSLDSLAQPGAGSTGLYGIVCVLCMLAPLALGLLRDRRAWFGYFAPLVFNLLVGLGTYWKLQTLTNSASDGMRAFGGAGMDSIVSTMMSQLLAAISLGSGAYVALAASVYLAWRGVMHRLSGR